MTNSWKSQGNYSENYWTQVQGTSIRISMKVWLRSRVISIVNLCAFKIQRLQLLLSTSEIVEIIHSTEWQNFPFFRPFEWFAKFITNYKLKNCIITKMISGHLKSSVTERVVFSYFATCFDFLLWGLLPFEIIMPIPLSRRQRATSINLPLPKRKY